MNFINITGITLEIGDHVIQLTMAQAEQLKEELNWLLPLNFGYLFSKNGQDSDTTSHT